MVCPDNIADMLIIVREQRQARITAAETLYKNSRINRRNLTDDLEDNNSSDSSVVDEDNRVVSGSRNDPYNYVIEARV